MARIPTYDPQIELHPVPTDRGPSVVPGAYGGQVAEATGRLGDTIAGVAMDVTKQINTVAVTEALNAAMIDQNKLVTDLSSRQGLNAAGIPAEYEAGITKMRSEALKKLNGVQQSAFSLRFDTMAAQGFESINRHAQHQLVNAEIGQHEALVQTYIDRGGTNPDTTGASLEGIKAEYTAIGNRLGLSTEDVNLKIKRASAQTLTGLIQTYSAQDQPELAQEVLHGNQDVFEADHYAQMDAHLSQGVTLLQSQKLADKAISDHPNDVGAQYQQVHESSDGKTRDMATQYIHQNETHVRAAQEAATRQQKGKVNAFVYRGGGELNRSVMELTPAKLAELEITDPDAIAYVTDMQEKAAKGGDINTALRTANTVEEQIMNLPEYSRDTHAQYQAVNDAAILVNEQNARRGGQLLDALAKKKNPDAGLSQAVRTYLNYSGKTGRAGGLGADILKDVKDAVDDSFWNPFAEDILDTSHSITYATMILERVRAYAHANPDADVSAVQRFYDTDPAIQDMLSASKLREWKAALGTQVRAQAGATPVPPKTEQQQVDYEAIRAKAGFPIVGRP